MKISILYFFILPLAVLISCKDDVAPEPTYDYHAHIFSPLSGEKHMGDTLHIEIEFESHTGENVEHINVQIFNSANQAVVYNLPSDPHVGAVESYDYEDDLVLSAANGFTEGDWVLQAKVWGHGDGEQEELSTVNFHIAN